MCCTIDGIGFNLIVEVGCQCRALVIVIVQDNASGSRREFTEQGAQLIHRFMVMRDVGDDRDVRVEHRN